MPCIFVKLILKSYGILTAQKGAQGPFGRFLGGATDLIAKFGLQHTVLTDQSAMLSSAV